MFRFGSKAENLEQLSEGREFTVLPLVRFSFREWTRDRDRVTDRVLDTLNEATLIVRSSAQDEDGHTESRAGEFDSVLDVSRNQLGTAVDDVFSSYGAPKAADEVFVQPMASGLRRSGVAMTCDPHTGAPYFVVNYSDGPDTEAVTAGRAVSSWTLLDSPDVMAPPRVEPLVTMMRELQRMTSHLHLDIEFGETPTGQLLLFQVRKVTTVRASSQCASNSCTGLRSATARAIEEFRSAQRHAERAEIGPSVLGVMPDWNPAELIGLKPRPLAYSLYETIITSDAWAAGRARLGYRDMRAVPLMHLVGGTPYILVSASLASFVPRTTPAHVQRELLEAAQVRLLASPMLHDKIEFAILPTCFKPSLLNGEWRSRFQRVTIEDWNDYVDKLLTLTNDLIGNPSVIGSMLTRHQELETLSVELVDRMRSSNSASDALALLRVAKVHGTELFSEVARSAFVASDILSDLARAETIPIEFLDGLVAQARTVSSKLVTDRAGMSNAEFLNRHGHIRPGTYEVTVPRYDADPLRYFSASVHSPTLHENASERYAGIDPDRLSAYLSDQGYSFSWDILVAFSSMSIQLREQVKHAFTRLLSEAMEIFVRYGHSFGLDREAVSFLTTADVAWVEQVATRRARRLTSAGARNRERWTRGLAVRLPDLLSAEEEIVFHEARVAQPTFVTRRRIEADVTTPRDSRIRGTVVCIERADPGFDWLFTHDIAGFVTRYGGENSHMAIRARELDIPAVIGAGDRFDRWSSYDRIVIDAGSQTVEAVL